ncbi:MAG: hypothetical protein ACJA1C_002001 [Crocinitomicaceae bacterium]|jgi:hypothetical protein
MKIFCLLTFLIAFSVKAQINDSIINDIQTGQVIREFEVYSKYYFGTNDTTIIINHNMCLSTKLKFNKGKLRKIIHEDHALGTEEIVNYNKKGRVKRVKHKPTWAFECNPEIILQ